MPTKKIILLKKIIHIAGKINAITCAFGFLIIYGFAGTMDYMDKFGWENSTSDTEIMIKVFIAGVISIITFLFAIIAERMEKIIDDELDARKKLNKKSLKCNDMRLEKKTKAMRPS